MAVLSARIRKLIALCNAVPDPETKKIAYHILSQLKGNISAMEEATAGLTADTPPHILCQYQEQLTDLKGELTDIRHILLSLNLTVSSSHAATGIASTLSL